MLCICKWKFMIILTLFHSGAAMKIKKKKSAILLLSVLVVIFGLDLSINAKDLNVFQDTSAANPRGFFSFTFVPAFLYLFSIGIVGLAVIGRGGDTHPSPAEARRSLPDKGGRRSKVERRQYQYDYIVPDRRSDKDRRENSERRLE